MLLIASALAATACASSPRKPATENRTCEVIPPPASPAESLSIGFTAAVDQARLFARPGVAEQFLLTHAYETLVRIDCERRILPGLARAWSVDSVAGRFTVVLRPDARFWGGDRVSAGEIVRSWRETSSDAPFAERVASNATAIDDTTLALDLRSVSLEALTDHELVVRRRRPGLTWPEGTGPFRVEESGAPGSAVTGRSIRLVPIPAGLPHLTMQFGASGRDLIDHGVDVVITDDGSIAAYAARADLAPVPLGWNRTMAILSPSSRPDSAASMRRWLEFTRPQRIELARDAVRGSARAAEEPFWWDEGSDCPPPERGSPVTTREMTARVVYRRGDTAGRTIAERVVALAAMGATRAANSTSVLLPGELVGPATRLTATGLGDAEFDAALRSGGVRLYVVDLRRSSLSPCADRLRLRQAVPWLDTQRTNGSWLLPLVDIGDQAFVKPGRAGYTLDWNGTLRLIAIAREAAR